MTLTPKEARETYLAQIRATAERLDPRSDRGQRLVVAHASARSNLDGKRLWAWNTLATELRAKGHTVSFEVEDFATGPRWLFVVTW